MFRWRFDWCVFEVSLLKVGSCVARLRDEMHHTAQVVCVC